MAAPVKRLRVLELFSGIGGMHYALEESGISYELVAAVDINTVANKVYSDNFPDIHLINKCILSMSAGDFNSFNVDMIVMSPPCQPFTAVGNHGDIDDVRTSSFLHILDLLPVLDKIPDYVLLENVRGFEQSLARQRLIEVLTQLHFTCEEYLLSPAQFGIPNSRMRYYMLARRVHPQGVCSDAVSAAAAATVASCHDIKKEMKVDQVITSAGKLSSTQFSPILPSSLQKFESVISPEARLLSQYLEVIEESNSLYAVPSKFYRQFWVMDLVRPQSTISCCFTKRYGHYIEGAGSILQTADSDRDLKPYKGRETSEEFIEGIRQLRLRFFTPREIANILGFPSHFKLPSSLTSKQCYRVLGNSLNVKVVSILLRTLTNSD